jgi:hypothetical protein
MPDARDMGYFVDVVRRWDQRSIESAGAASLLLLFNVGMALLPACLVEDFSYEQNPEVISFVVGKAYELLGNLKRPAAIDAACAETLRRALGYAAKLFPEHIHASCARAMLVWLNDESNIERTPESLD